MGRQTDDQGHLFYDFCLAEAVPDDHPVRKIDAVVDLSWVYGELCAVLFDTRSAVDRPCADDADADHRLCLWPALRAVVVSRGAGELRLSLVLQAWHRAQDPDHSVFSRARNERFRDSGIFRRVFERVVEACIAAGLVGGEGFAWMRA